MWRRHAVAKSPGAETENVPRLIRALAVLGLVVGLSACQTRVESRVEVSSTGSVARSVQVTLRDEAAAATLASIETAKMAVARQAGADPSAVVVSGDADELTLAVAVPTGIVAPASGVGEALATVENGEVLLQAELTDIAELRAALDAAVADQEDAEALREAMGRSVELCVIARMPGRVLEASEVAVVDGRSASVCRVVEEWTPAALEVRSESAAEGVLSSVWVRYVGAALLLCGAAWIDRARRRRRA